LNRAVRRTLAVWPGDLFEDRAVGGITVRRLAEQGPGIMRFQETQVGVIGRGGIPPEVFEYVSKSKWTR
jgi:hypothetical protein